MLKKYRGYIIEKYTSNLILLLESVDGPIESTSNFLERMAILSKSNGVVGVIATAICVLLEDGIEFNSKDIKQNFFDITDKEDKVTFLMQNKVPKDWDSFEDPDLPFNSKGRSEIKIGRILKYLIDLYNKEYNKNIEIKDKDIEDFVNAYKASNKDDDKEFVLVKGKDIIKYYNIESYAMEVGTLGNSCMAREDGEFFKLYSKNPDTIQLLIYVDKSDKIHGRALVWKMDVSPCAAKYFMDRVYTIKDSDVLKFKAYAKENGWMYKKNMSSGIDESVKFVYNDSDVFGEVVVKLKKSADYGEYAPYLDTLMFSDDVPSYLTNISFKDAMMLLSTDGEIYPCWDCEGSMVGCTNCEEGYIECSVCDGSGEIGNHDTSESTYDDCENCDATGLIKCDECQGDYLCMDCSEGHIILEKKGIPTKYNKLRDTYKKEKKSKKSKKKK
jgi:hypothetical protein